MGKITFAADSLHNLNHGIVDLELAPRDNDGLVQFTADISILAPVDLNKGNGKLIAVPKRG